MPFFFLLLTRPPPLSTLFPYTTLFRSSPLAGPRAAPDLHRSDLHQQKRACRPAECGSKDWDRRWQPESSRLSACRVCRRKDRKSTRLNSSHTVISYAVFCLKKKKKNNN